MAVQPVLSEEISSFSEMKLLINESNGYFDISSDVADEAHIHSCYEIYVNLTGDVSFLHGGEIYPIKSGDAIISFPGDVHHCIYHSSCRHNHFCIWFDSSEAGDFLKRNNIRGRIRPTEANLPKILLALEALAKKASDPFLRAAKIMELFSLLLEDGVGEAEPSPGLPTKMTEMLRYVDDNFLSVSGTAELCGKFYLSESSINRMFKKYVGISPGALLEAKRLSYAEGLLRQDRSVTDACYLSGFTDCSRFIAKFKKKFGVTPLKYKQRLFS